MRDIHLAIALIVAVSTGVMLASLWTGSRISRKSATLLCATAVAFLIAHVVFISDRLWVAQLIPSSGVPILGNWLLPTVAALAGFAWRIIPGGVVRRSLLLVPLVAVCGHRSFHLAFAEPPTILTDWWSGDVCRQTSPASCGAAAAATLLRAHGIRATEPEMARLCLTRTGGTTNLGLYRGLKLKTTGTAWDVEALHTDVDGLRNLTGPALLSVRLERGGDVDPRYEQLWGWTPGVAHTVVFFGFTDDGKKVLIGDPAVGLEKWSARDIGVLWHGEGLRLVEQ